MLVNGSRESSDAAFTELFCCHVRNPGHHQKDPHGVTARYRDNSQPAQPRGDECRMVQGSDISRELEIRNVVYLNLSDYATVAAATESASTVESRV